MRSLGREWCVFVLRGVLAVLFGVVAFAWPGPTIRLFVLVFGIYAILDGVFSLAAAVRPAPGESRWVLTLLGILGLAVGIFVLVRPGLSAVALVYVTAIWAIVTGIAEVVAAIALRRVIEGEWLFVVSGVLSVLLGLFLVTRPAAGILGLLWAVAIYAVIAGITLIALGFRLRSWARAQRTG